MLATLPEANLVFVYGGVFVYDKQYNDDSNAMH